MAHDKKTHKRKHLLIPNEVVDMLDEMSKETVRSDTDMIVFCIKEQYKRFKS